MASRIRSTRPRLAGGEDRAAGQVEPAAGEGATRRHHSRVPTAPLGARPVRAPLGVGRFGLDLRIVGFGVASRASGREASGGRRSGRRSSTRRSFGMGSSGDGPHDPEPSEPDADPVEVARTIAFRKLAASARTRHELDTALQTKNVSRRDRSRRAGPDGGGRSGRRRRPSPRLGRVASAAPPPVPVGPAARAEVEGGRARARRRGAWRRWTSRTSWRRPARWRPRRRRRCAGSTR